MIARGVCWKLWSITCFVVSDVLVRYLTTVDQWSVESLTVVQYGMATFVLFVFSTNPLKSFCSCPRKYRKWYILKIFFSFVGIHTWSLALKSTSLSKTAFFGCLNPLFTWIGARFFLNERLTWYQTKCNILVFLTLWILYPPMRWYEMRSEMGSEMWLMIPPLCFASTKIISRYLRLQGETAENMTNLQVLWNGLLALVVWTSTKTIKSPSNEIYPRFYNPLVVILSGLTLSARYADSKAYGSVHISSLISLGMFKILLTVVMDVLIFDIQPSQNTILGLSFFFLSSLLFSLKN
jgi:drug/metabolite transporter (DMT)-like permease